MPGPLDDVVLGAYEREKAKASETGATAPTLGQYVDEQARRFDRSGQPGKARRLRDFLVGRQAEALPATAAASADALEAAGRARGGELGPLTRAFYGKRTREEEGLIATAQAERVAPEAAPPTTEGNAGHYSTLDPAVQADLLEAAGVPGAREMTEGMVRQNFGRTFGERIQTPESATAAAEHLWIARGQREAQARKVGDLAFPNGAAARDWIRAQEEADRQSMETAKEDSRLSTGLLNGADLLSTLVTRGLSPFKPSDLLDPQARAVYHGRTADVVGEQPWLGPLMEATDVAASWKGYETLGAGFGNGLKVLKVPVAIAKPLAGAMTVGWMAAINARTADGSPASMETRVDAGQHGAAVGALAGPLAGIFREAWRPEMGTRGANILGSALGFLGAEYAASGGDLTNEAAVRAFVMGAGIGAHEGHVEAGAEARGETPAILEARRVIRESARVETPTRRILDRPYEGPVRYRGPGLPPEAGPEGAGPSAGPPPPPAAPPAAPATAPETPRARRAKESPAAWAERQMREAMERGRAAAAAGRGASAAPAAEPPVEAPAKPRTVLRRPQPALPAGEPAGPETGKPYAVRGFRGVTEGRDPAAPGQGGVRFFTPDEAGARKYAGGKGKVHAEDLSFKNPLVAEGKSLEDLAKAAGLDADALPHDVNAAREAIYSAARKAGHDAILAPREGEIIDLTGGERRAGAVEGSKRVYSPEERAAIPADTPVVVRMKGGEIIEGKWAGEQDGTLSVNTPTGQRDVVAAEVERVHPPKAFKAEGDRATTKPYTPSVSRPQAGDPGYEGPQAEGFTEVSRVKPKDTGVRSNRRVLRTGKAEPDKTTLDLGSEKRTVGAAAETPPPAKPEKPFMGPFTKAFDRPGRAEEWVNRETTKHESPERIDAAIEQAKEYGDYARSEATRKRGKPGADWKKADATARRYERVVRRLEAIKAERTKPPEAPKAPEPAKPAAPAEEKVPDGANLIGHDDKGRAVYDLAGMAMTRKASGRGLTQADPTRVAQARKNGPKGATDAVPQRSAAPAPVGEAPGGGAEVGGGDAAGAAPAKGAPAEGEAKPAPGAPAGSRSEQVKALKERLKKPRTPLKPKGGVLTLDSSNIPLQPLGQPHPEAGKPRYTGPMREEPATTTAGRDADDIAKPASPHALLTAFAREGWGGAFQVVEQGKGGVFGSGDVYRARKAKADLSRLPRYAKGEAGPSPYLLRWTHPEGGFDLTVVPEVLGIDSADLEGVKGVHADMADLALEGLAKRPKGKHSEAGFLLLPNLRAAEDLYRDVRDAAFSGARWTGSVIRRLRLSRGRAPKELARRAERAINFSREAYGEMSRAAVSALKTGGAPAFTPLGRAATRLSRPEPVPGKGWAKSPLVEILEGRRQPSGKSEEKIVQALQNLIQKRGSMFERAGLQQYDPASGLWAPFTVKGREIAPRVMSVHLYEVIKTGRHGELWNPLIDAISDASGVARNDVEKDLTERHEAFASEGPESLVRRTQAEFKRTWPEMPAYLRHRGEWVPLFESRPYSYARLLADRGAARLGFVKEFGVNPKRQDAVLRQLREDFASETGRPQDLVEVMRGLHGLSLTTPLVDPSAWGSRAWRAVNTGLGLAREMLLSASAIPNFAEPLGNIRDLAGNRGLVRAQMDLMRALAERVGGRRSALDTLELMGAITRDVVDVSLDPARKVSSAVRAVRDASGRVFVHRAVNEWQEKLAAFAGSRFVERLRSGKATYRDLQRLRVMGFPEALAKRLHSGTATMDEYLEVVRRAPASTVGATLHRLEQSHLENRRLMKALVAFQRYAFTIWRNSWGQIDAFQKGMRDAWEAYQGTPQRAPGGQNVTFRVKDPAKAFRIAGSAARHLVEHLLGKTLQGSAAYFLAAFATGGMTGLNLAWNEFKDHPAGFLADSLLFTMLSGPFGVIARIGAGDANPINFAFPLWAGKEIVTGLAGTDTYRDLSFGDRMSQLFSRMVPVSRVVENGLTAVGFGSREGFRIEVARRAYWRWRYAEGMRPASHQEGDVADASAAFRREMKAAYRALEKARDPEAVREHVEKALGIQGKEPKAAASSLRSRRLLNRPEVEGRLDELRSRIGEEAYGLLEVHDALLDRLASAISNSTDRTRSRKVQDAVAPTPTPKKPRRTLRPGR